MGHGGGVGFFLFMELSFRLVLVLIEEQSFEVQVEGLREVGL